MYDRQLDMCWMYVFLLYQIKTDLYLVPVSIEIMH